MNVLDAIDRPIRPLVVQLNRIGIRTMWSCCGFSYKGEEEKKSHNKVPFVVFHAPKTFEEANAFQLVIDVANVTGWFVHNYSRGLWRMIVPNRQLVAEGWEGGTDAVHAYEVPLIAITQMTECLNQVKLDRKEIVIVDGNQMQKEMFPLIANEWVVEPKPTAVIKVEDISLLTSQPSVA